MCKKNDLISDRVHMTAMVASSTHAGKPQLQTTPEHAGKVCIF